MEGVLQSYDNLYLLGRLSRDLSTSHPRKVARIRVIRRLLEGAPEGGVCLDIGTAHGGVTSQYVGTRAWHFVDWNANHKAVASSILQGEYFAEDVLSFLPKPSFYDVVVLPEMVGYFANPRELFDKIFQSLKPGGMLLMAAEELSGNDVLDKFRTRLGLIDAMGWHQVLPAAKYVDVMRQAGFVIERQERYFGFLGQAWTTMLDLLTLKPDTRAGVENRLTHDLLEEKSIWVKRLACLPLRGMSFLLTALDLVFLTSHRYGRAVIGTKPKGRSQT